MGSAKTAIDWSKWDNTSFFDEYMQQPRIDRENIVTLYDYPITTERYRKSTPEGVKNMVRLALWMPGEQGRTKPLVEEHFEYGDLMELVYERRRKTYSYNRDEPPETAFLVEWYHKNAGEIEKARFRRHGGMGAYLRPEDADVPVTSKTRTFKGEDGLTYSELCLTDEDTDPVLLNATMNRESILREQDERRIREQAAAAERKQREFEEAQERLRIAAEKARLEEERKAREQDEFEAMPCWGAF